MQSKSEQFTESNEGYRQFTYLCPAQKWTVGIGFNLDDVGLSHEESRVILKMRLRAIESQLSQLLHGYDAHNDARQAALADMAYQMGVNGLLKFKRSLAYMAAIDYDSAADEFLNSNWAKQTPIRAKKVTEMIRTGEW